MAFNRIMRLGTQNLSIFPSKSKPPDRGLSPFIFSLPLVSVLFPTCLILVSSQKMKKKTHLSLSYTNHFVAGSTTLTYVLRFRAKPNGITDFTQTFVDAWSAPCASTWFRYDNSLRACKLVRSTYCPSLQRLVYHVLGVTKLGSTS